MNPANRRKWLAVVLCILVSQHQLAPAANEDAGGRPEAAELLALNLAAVWGRKEPFDIESVDQTLEIAEGENQLTARYRAAANGTMRIDVFANTVRVFSEGKDEQGVWEWPGDQPGPDDVFHDGAGALEHGVEFNVFALADFPQRGHRVELVGEEIIDGQHYYILRVTLSDGFETYRYLNRTTWRVDLARDKRAFHPGLDPGKINIETRFDRWRQEDGPVYAGRSRDFNSDTGELLSSVTVSTSRYNLPLEELDIGRDSVP